MSSCSRSWLRSARRGCSTSSKPRLQASLLRESTEVVGRFDVRARADQPHAVPGAGRDAPCAAAPPGRRGHRAAVRRRLRRASGRAGAALAAGHGVGRQAKSSRLLAAGRAAGARQPRAERGRKAVRRRTRHARLGRERCPVRGADRARRGAAADGRCRPTARRCWRRRESQRSWGTQTSPPARRSRTTAVSRAASAASIVERVAAIERALELDDPPQPARHARLLALLAKELAFEPDRARRRALADEAIALARQASDPRTLATALESSCYAIWAPDTLASAVRASSRAERAGRAGGGSARRVRRQAPGD